MKMKINKRRIFVVLKKWRTRSTSVVFKCGCAYPLGYVKVLQGVHELFS